MRRWGTVVVCVTAVAALAGCAASSTPKAAPAASAVSSPKPSASPSWDCSAGSSLSQADWVAHCRGTDNATAPPAMDTAGSVTTKDGAFVQYPNGMREEITAVAIDNAFGKREQDPDSAHPTFDGGLHITVKFTNNGTAAYQLKKAYGGMSEHLTFGQNEYDATEYAPDDQLPNQLVPGTGATQTYDYTLPAAEERDNLRLTVTPDEQVFTKYTFTDVQTLIH